MKKKLQISVIAPLKNIKGLLLFLFLFHLLSNTANAQNCTVNANVDQTICYGTTVTLTGATSGSFSGGSPVVHWSQISGPTVVITSPTSLVTTITGYPDTLNTYKFRLSTNCLDGIFVYDEVNITIKPHSIVNAGPDKYACPNGAFLEGSALGPNETGVWTRILTPTNGDFSVTSPTSATSAIVASTNYAGVYDGTWLMWTVTNTNGCIASDTVIIKNLGGQTPVNAGPDQNLANCNSSTITVADLNASNGGNDGASLVLQSGTWSLVNGPNNPSFDNINSPHARISNLIAGTYTLRWTVQGNCASGSDDVNITVPATYAPSTPSGGFGSVYICDGSTSSTMTHFVYYPAYETITWTQDPYNSPQLTISDIHNSSPQVSGISNSVAGNYHFTATIYNTITGCTGTYQFHFYVSIPNAPINIISPSPIIGTCGATSITVLTDSDIDTVSSIYGQNLTLISKPIGHIPYLANITNVQTVNGKIQFDITGLTTPGMYVVRIPRTVACYNTPVTSFYDATIVISNSSTSANAGTSQILACNVTTTTLQGNVPTANGSSGHWTQVSGPNTATMATPNTASNLLTGLIQGAYKFRWSINTGTSCPNTQSDVTVLVSTSPPSSSAGTNQSTCYGGSFKLSGNTPTADATGVWTVSPSTGLTFSPSVNAPNAVVTGMTSPNTAYTFTWTVTNHCFASASQVVITTTNTPAPTDAIAGPDQCFPNDTTSITLAGNNPIVGIGLWTITSGPNTPTFTNSGLYNTSVTGMVPGTYIFQWAITNGSCTNYPDTVIITISGTATTANAGPDQNVCGTSTILSANIPTAGSGLWTQVSGNVDVIFTDASSPTTTVSGMTTGTYVLLWTVSTNSCSTNSDSVQISVSGNTATTPLAGPDLTNCGVNFQSINATVTMAANSVAPGYGVWTFVSGPNVGYLADATSPTTTVQLNAAGDYIYRWNSYLGACPVLYDDIKISVTGDLSNYTPINLVACGASATVLTGLSTQAGTWSQVGNTPNTATITSSGVNSAIAGNLTTGSYTFNYAIPAIGSCPSQSRNYTFVNNPLVSLNAGPDQHICGPNTSFTLNATINAGLTGAWQKTAGPAGGSFSNINSPTTTFTGAVAGTYTFTWFCNSSSSCFATDEMVIYNASVTSTAAAGTDQLSLCSSHATMAATAVTSGIGIWTLITKPAGAPDPVISSPAQPNTLITNLVPLSYPSDYVFRWTVSNDTCPSTFDEVTLRVNESVTTANAGVDQQLCTTSTSTLLNGNQAVSGAGTWVKISGPTATITTPTAYNTTVTGLTTGVYVLEWQISNGTCTSTDQVTLTVLDAPSTASTSGTTTSICQFSTMNLVGNTPIYGTGVWTQTAGTSVVITNPNVATTSVTGANVGSYSFLYSISNGACTISTSSVTITINDVPTPALAGTDQFLCDTLTTYLAANTPTIGTGTWTQVSGSSAVIADASSPTSGIILTADGAYVFKWETTLGTCTSSDTVQITKNTVNLVASTTVHPTCNTANGTIVVSTPAEGSGYEYNVDGGAYQTSATFSLPAGTYTIGARPLANLTCVPNPMMVTVNTQPALPNAPSLSVVQSCTPSSGSITITSVVGETYSFDGSAYTATLVYSGLASGSTHTIISKNTGGCTSTTTVTLDVAPAAPTITITQPTCAVQTGTITITAVEGQTYSFDGGSYIATLIYSGLTANSSHTIIAQTAGGCISQISNSNINAQPSSSATPIGTVSADQTVCDTANLTDLSVTGYSGTVTSWQKASDAAFTTSVTAVANASATLSPATILPLTGNSYFRAVITNGSCVANSPGIKISVTNVSTAGASICVGGSGVLTVTASNCMDLTYTNTVSDIIINTGNATILNANRLVSGAQFTSCAFENYTRPYIKTLFKPTTTGSYGFAHNTYPSWIDMMGYVTTADFTPGNCTAGGTFLMGDDDSFGAGRPGIYWVNLTAGTTYALITQTKNDNTGLSNGATLNWNVQGGTVKVGGLAPTVDWYTTPTGGSPIGSGTNFNPVGVPGSGLANTNTPGTTVFYAACPLSPGCRVATNFTISGTPSAPAVSATQPSCAVPTATVTITPVAGETYNYDGNGYTSTLQYAGQQQNSIHTIDAKNAGGCTSSTTSIQIGLIPVTAVGGTVSGNQSIISGTQVTTNLTATPTTGTVAHWEMASNTGFSSPTTINVSSNTLTGAQIGNLNATTYFRAVVQDGCTFANATNYVTITVSSGITTSPNQVICSNTQPTNLSISGYNGSITGWQSSVDALFTTPTAINNTSATLSGATIGNLTATTYFRAVTNNGATNYSPAITISITAAPTAATLGSNSPVQAGSTILLTASVGNAVSYSWSGPNGYTSIVQNPSLTNASALANGTYTATVTDSVTGCQNTSTINVTVNGSLYTQIPDVNFEQRLIDLGYDDVIDGQVLTANISGITSLNVASLNIASLTGMQDFAALQTLYCQSNSLSTLNLTSNTNLNWLSCSSNNLSSLNVTGLTNLTFLDCSQNILPSLNLSSNTNLITAYCGSNSLLYINVNGLTNLQQIECNTNSLTTLDLTSNLGLTSVNCDSNSLTSLNLSPSAPISTLSCQFNQLTNINVSTYTNMIGLYCAFNQFTYLDVSNNSSLAYLYAYANTSLLCIKVADAAVAAANTNWVVDNTALYSSSPSNTADAGTVSGNQSINAGTQAAMIYAYPNVGNVIYWQKSTDAAFTTPITIASTNSFLNGYEMAPLAVTSYFRAVVHDGCSTAYSTNYVTVTVTGIAGPYTAIPDAHFEATLIQQGYDDIFDGQVLTSNISGLMYLDVSNKNIADLTGIQDFAALQTLYCYSNNLTTLNLSSNSNLTYFDSDNNLNLATLNVNGLTNLTGIDCYSGILTSLDISTNTNLNYLDCDTNHLTSLNLNGASSLQTLYCNSNNLTSLNTCSNTNLSGFDASSNAITTFDIRNNPSLSWAYMNNQTPSGASIYVVNANATGGSWIIDGNATYIDGTVGGTASSDQAIASGSQPASLTLTGNLGTVVKWQSASDATFTTNVVDFANTTTTLTGAEMGVLNATTYYRAVLGGGTCTPVLSYTSSVATITVAPITLIPDPNFEQALIDLGYDDVIDGHVLTSNISGVTSLFIPNYSISDLTGIQDFISLGNLACSNNLLTNLDLTHNLGLYFLQCDNNLLNVLNIPPTASYMGIYCQNNQLTHFNFPSGVSTSDFDCSSNLLTYLDISNTPIVYFNAVNNPSLSCILVADVPAAIANISWSIDSTALYSSSPTNTADAGTVSGDQTITSGTTPTTNLTATPNIGTVAYWQKAIDTAFTVPVDIANTTNTLTSAEIGNLTATTYFRTVVQDGCSIANATNYATITVTGGGGLIYTLIPDLNFEQYLINQGIDTNPVPDGKVLTSAISGVTSLNLFNLSIADLTGLQDFVSLTSLDCRLNTISSLNVSTLTNLTNLQCGYSSLTGGLDISQNMALTTLECVYAGLTTIDVANHTNLTSLTLQGNSLTSIDVAANTNLSYLDVTGNLLPSLNVSTNLSLTTLNASSNQLTTLDVSANTSLTTLVVSSNPISSLNVNANSNLQYLNVQLTNLTTLDVTANTLLTTLEGSYCHFTTLDLTHNPLMQRVWVNDNQLTSIIGTETMTQLNQIGFYNNLLTTINVCSSTNISYLQIFGNNLTTVDVSNSSVYYLNTLPGNPSLTTIYVNNVSAANAQPTNLWIKDGAVNYVLGGNAVGGTLDSTTACTGTNSSTLTLAGYTGRIVKWQSSTTADFSANVTDIANSVETLTVTNLAVTTYYRAVLFNGTCSADAYSTTGTITLGNCSPTLTLSVYLEGALMENNGATAPDGRPMMRDDLRMNPFTGAINIPTQDPYTTFNANMNVDLTSLYTSVGPGLDPVLQIISNPTKVFGVSGQNAIVDWVFVELRDKNDAATVVATRSALVQRDGDVVDLDGESPLSFPGVTTDDYFVAIRHRSHLGVMTATAMNLSQLAGLIDFTSTSTPLWNKGVVDGLDYTGLSTNVNVVAGYSALWAGNFNGEGQIKYDNPNDDQANLLLEVLLDADNTDYASNFDFGFGYFQGDYNMDGKVKFDNPGDDLNYLLLQILLYPLNNIDYSTNFDFMIEQLP